MSFNSPDLIYPLDCKFNRQLNEDYNQNPWTDKFWKYHSCHGKKSYNLDNTFIVHLNGNSTNFNNYLIESYIQSESYYKK